MRGFWSFSNDFARYIVSFGVDNSSSSQNSYWKNNFLLLGGGPTDGINDGTGVAEKEILLTLVKQRQNFS